MSHNNCVRHFSQWDPLTQNLCKITHKQGNFTTLIRPGGGTKFGYSSQDEMAIVSLRYYPKPQGRNFLFVCAYGIPVPTCLVDYNSTELSSVTELGRTFGVSTDDAAVAKSISGSPACFAASTKDVHFDPDASDESPNSGGAMLQNSAILLVTATMATALAFGGV